ncbi:MAG: DUF11 domain-containing protein [Burkholderiales bacterium]|nr:DUF11 domain-containing protein [Burkholderiales bacterium]
MVASRVYRATQNWPGVASLGVLRWATACAVALTVVAPAASIAAVAAQLVSSNATPVAGGSAFTLTLTLSNNAVAVSDLIATLPMPNSINVIGVAVAGPDAGALSCRIADPAPTTVVCRAPSFAANASATVTATVQVSPETASGARTAAARVVGSGVESTSSAALTLSSNASLSVSKTGPGVGVAGEPMTYTLAVSNTGNSVAINAVVSDFLPSGFEFLGVSARGALDGTCHFNPSTRELRCDVPQMPTGSHRVSVLVEPRGNLAPGSISNTATVSAASGSISVGSSGASAQLGHSRLDIDNNGVYEPQFDGVLVARYLFGQAPSTLVSAALGANAARATPSRIIEYLDFIRPQLDVDGDGLVRPLSDGLLIVRYLLGLRGNNLISGVVAPGATRTTIATLEAYLASLTPP